MIQQYYVEYFSQAWYVNTFLVRKPEQIGQSIRGERDWNNIHDSGCNFVCLAMMVGVDPARMASILAAKRYFFADTSLPAVTVGGKYGGLVWDMNGPSEESQSVVLENIWHSHLRRRETITITLDSITETDEHKIGKEIIARARRLGLHVICGPEEHSHLVAGRISDDYYVWDPDDTVVSVEDNLRGKIRLKKLFDDNLPGTLEFWLYRVDVT